MPLNGGELRIEVDDDSAWHLEQPHVVEKLGIPRGCDGATISKIHQRRYSEDGKCASELARASLKVVFIICSGCFQSQNAWVKNTPVLSVFVAYRQPVQRLCVA